MEHNEELVGDAEAGTQSQCDELSATELLEAVCSLPDPLDSPSDEETAIRETFQQRVEGIVTSATPLPSILQAMFGTADLPQDILRKVETELKHMIKSGLLGRRNEFYKPVALPEDDEFEHMLSDRFTGPPPLRRSRSGRRKRHQHSKKRKRQ